MSKSDPFESLLEVYMSLELIGVEVGVRKCQNGIGVHRYTGVPLSLCSFENGVLGGIPGICHFLCGPVARSTKFRVYSIAQSVNLSHSL